MSSWQAPIKKAQIEDLADSTKTRTGTSSTLQVQRAFFANINWYNPSSVLHPGSQSSALPNCRTVRCSTQGGSLSHQGEHSEHADGSGDGCWALVGDGEMLGAVGAGKVGERT